MRNASRTVMCTFGVIIGSGLVGITPVRAQRHLIPDQQLVSTVPSNGDLNPYGVAFVPAGFPSGGLLQPGDILVSNFNSSANLQGTGTTITQVRYPGATSTFFQGVAPLGLTTALGILKAGFVIVGNLPTSDGTSATLQLGSLLVINSQGALIATWQDSSLLNGPWDLAIDDEGNRAKIFVSNVMSGTITRIDVHVASGGLQLVVDSKTQIASGYTHHTDPAALVIGPTGLAYDRDRDILYIASTGDNAVYAVRHARSRSTDAGLGTLICQDNDHLRGPLGLTLTPDGHLLTTNGDAVNPSTTYVSELVEFTTSGHFLAQFSIDPTAPGGAFGIALVRAPHGILLAAVDDVTNQLQVWNFSPSVGGDDGR